MLPGCIGTPQEATRAPIRNGNQPRHAPRDRLLPKSGHLKAQRRPILTSLPPPSLLEPLPLVWSGGLALLKKRPTLQLTAPPLKAAVAGATANPQRLPSWPPNDLRPAAIPVATTPKWARRAILTPPRPRPANAGMPKKNRRSRPAQSPSGNSARPKFPTRPRSSRSDVSRRTPRARDRASQAASPVKERPSVSDIGTRYRSPKHVSRVSFEVLVFLGVNELIVVSCNSKRQVFCKLCLVKLKCASHLKKDSHKHNYVVRCGVPTLGEGKRFFERGSAADAKRTPSAFLYRERSSGLPRSCLQMWWTSW